MIGGNVVICSERGLVQARVLGRDGNIVEQNLQD